MIFNCVYSRLNGEIFLLSFSPPSYKSKSFNFSYTIISLTGCWLLLCVLEEARKFISLSIYFQTYIEERLPLCTWKCLTHASRLTDFICVLTVSFFNKTIIFKPNHQTINNYHNCFDIHIKNEIPLFTFMGNSFFFFF